MSATDELRMFAEGCYPGTCGALKAFADRIDAEIAERYMLLPTGADNKPIHVGDIVEWAFIKEDPMKVVGVSPTSLFYPSYRKSVIQTGASDKRQVVK